ncbi:heme peroxidase [Gnomoniopsis sp. IMI 355080]|nr:heme peroxidase [Gnomoniopsis sp. IMI 355080]
MASSTRQIAQAASRLTTRRTLTTATPRAAFRQRYSGQGQHRFYSSAPEPAKSSPLPWIIGAAAVGGAGFYFYSQNDSSSATPKVFNPTKEDYQKVYNYIAARLDEKDDYDDGSYGPVLLRLAWHCSGTYDELTKTGGSNGATMRFAPEADHGANAGLKHARDFLEPVKEKFPWITYSDLWILGGVCAIQEMMGPKIPYRPGRSDRDVAACTPDGRLPDGSKGQDHLRNIFNRMGFNDQEIVALSGAHALGRCHTDRSGFDGPWTFSPTVLTNDYFQFLTDRKWHWKKWDGPKQYVNEDESIMMLPADMALVADKKFKEWVVKYAKDGDKFFEDFRNVIVKLFELGVPFAEGKERWEFKTLGEQEK